MVATTDGVGTKLKIAIETGRLETIGIDLVAMCVNDLIVQGAEPLLFLDYFATGRLDVERGRAIIAGIAEGCRIAGCALVGGETAEMPGLYQGDDFDLAGFAVGAVERGEALDGSAVAPGDVVLGIASSGVHSNGFSLVRRIVADAGATWSDPAPYADGKTIGETLLEPTRIYVRPVLQAVRGGGVHALAHITGGGLVENVPRVLPKDAAVAIDVQRWPIPPIFDWIAETGRVAGAEMARTFNCGIGMVAIVGRGDVDRIEQALAAAGLASHRIGSVGPRAPGAAGCTVAGIAERWPG